jgi:hypothetical protein
METADWVKWTRAAALVTLPVSATVTSERSEARSRLRAISRLLMTYASNIHFTYATGGLIYQASE